MKLNGVESPYLTPASARRAGIAIVHQWGDLVPTMTVEENIFLGSEIHGAFGMLNKNEMRRKAREVLNELGVDVDPGLHGERALAGPQADCRHLQSAGAAVRSSDRR